MEFGRKNKKEIIIKLVQQSKALKSIGKFEKDEFTDVFVLCCRYLTSSDFDVGEGTLKKSAERRPLDRNWNLEGRTKQK